MFQILKLIVKRFSTHLRINGPLNLSCIGIVRRCLLFIQTCLVGNPDQPQSLSANYNNVSETALSWMNTKSLILIYVLHRFNI